jgi:hypothetical protein
MTKLARLHVYHSNKNSPPQFDASRLFTELYDQDITFLLQGVLALFGHLFMIPSIVFHVRLGFKACIYACIPQLRLGTHHMSCLTLYCFPVT